MKNGEPQEKSGTPKVLTDDGARRAAMTRHDQSCLVEAGAGSGKTAIMAGRIAALLAGGAAPGSIAAVTFTELAASELLMRVRKFATSLSVGHIPSELRTAFPHGLTQKHLQHLQTAIPVIDEITCSTIHGFCQRLIKPYPAEANIDPGARVMDSKQADLTFLDIIDGWLREHLSNRQDSVLAEMVVQEPGKSVELVREIAQNLRSHRSLQPPPQNEPLLNRMNAFKDATVVFKTFINRAPAQEEDTLGIVCQLGELASRLMNGPSSTTATGLVRILNLRPDPELLTQKGTFRSYRKAGNWDKAAKVAGLTKTEGKQLNAEATQHYDACGNVWESLMSAVASQALAALIREAQPILARYRDYKRDTAQLDFDDLIFSARDLLREHESVRRALGNRFKHILVDEFQDTDPLQSEIFWRLCGEPPHGTADWTRFQIRPGALFLVGDPKQAIYRFRGADISAYTRARETFADSLLSISTNFRSRASILSYVNGCFHDPLKSPGQPGFTALDAFHDDPQTGAPCVAALPIDVPTTNGKAKAEDQRDAEAEAVAKLCAQFIGSWSVLDHRTGKERLCKPGDIALLAPTGTDLWRYEEALEGWGIPVATQAGKGFYRRQEIQDLIAITRVLADARDTLALGALLRGPLLGFTEEALLDVVWALPRSQDEPERIPRLSLWTEIEVITDARLQETIQKLQSLARAAHAKTPHQLLSEAIDVMRVRPILLQRHGGQAERALANLDLYLSLSQGYAVRGLRAFSEAMTAAWTDETRAIEGRPDAQEEAVALITMHAAKGLEWPIVIPINTMTLANFKGSSVIDRQTGTFYCPVLGISPDGHEAALQTEKDEQARERVRLWYVAATRARELLILPRIAAEQPDSAWIRLVDLKLQDLPVLDVSGFPTEIPQEAPEPENPQSLETFKAEAQSIAAHVQTLRWESPSRQDERETVATEDTVRISAESSDKPMGDAADGLVIQGGRNRGLVLHKLMEEILTGETQGAAAAVTARANVLIGELGYSSASDPGLGVSAEEVSACVMRTLALPEIAVLRVGLLAEVPLYTSRADCGEEIATAGIADALTLSADGRPDIVVDWKSDVNPTPSTLDHYHQQVRSYLRMTGAKRGLIVLMTTGTVIRVDSGSAIE